MGLGRGGAEKEVKMAVNIIIQENNSRESQMEQRIATVCLKVGIVGSS